MVKYVFTAVLLIASTCLAVQTADVDYQVVQIVEYCRHGARTNFKKLPFMDLVGLYGPGMLTGTGMRQHYLLGKELRNRYPTIFANQDKLTDFEVYSTYYPRT